MSDEWGAAPRIARQPDGEGMEPGSEAGQAQRPSGYSAFGRSQSQAMPQPPSSSFSQSPSQSQSHSEPQSPLQSRSQLPLEQQHQQLPQPHLPFESQPAYGATAPGLSQVQSQPHLPPVFGEGGAFPSQARYGVAGEPQGTYGGPGAGTAAGESQGTYGDPVAAGMAADAPLVGGAGYGGAYAGAPYGGAASGQANGLALAGAVLSVLPLVGLVFSIIGLTRAKALGGAGKTVATVGIVLSVLFAAGWGTAGYIVVTEVANSTAVDPACIAAESAAASMESELSADESALAAAESSDESGTVKTALGKMVSDMETIRGELDEDVAKATHARVKAKLQTLDTDLGTMIVDLRAAGGGDVSAANDLKSVAEKLAADGDTVDSLCGDLTNG